MTALLMILLYVVIAAIILYIIFTALEQAFPGIITPRLKGLIYLLFLLIFILWFLNHFWGIKM